MSLPKSTSSGIHFVPLLFIDSKDWQSSGLRVSSSSGLLADVLPNQWTLQAERMEPQLLTATDICQWSQRCMVPVIVISAGGRGCGIFVGPNGHT